MTLRNGKCKSFRIDCVKPLRTAPAWICRCEQVVALRAIRVFIISLHPPSSSGLGLPCRDPIQGLHSVADRRLTARSHEVSERRDSSFDLFNRSEIWQAPWQQCCRDPCQILEQYDHINISWLGDFTRSYGKTSFRLMNIGAGELYPSGLETYVATCCQTYNFGSFFRSCRYAGFQFPWWH